MSTRYLSPLALALLLLLPPALAAQASAPEIQIPRLIRISGTLSDLSDSASPSLESITFTLYQDQAGTTPLWSETQNIQVGPHGRYQALLGADTPDGIPLSLFSAAEARWLGVHRVGQEEQPLVMFVSVPYALKAADAESLGGKPPSAYITVDQLGSAPDKAAGQPRVLTENAYGPIYGEGRERYHARFTGPNTLTWSRIFESSTGIGIYTDNPVSAFDVRGEITAHRFTTIDPGTTDYWSWDHDVDPLNFTKSRFRLLWRPPQYRDGWGIITVREGAIAIDHDNPRTALDVNGWITTNGRLSFTQDLGMSTPVYGMDNVQSRFQLYYLPAFHQWEGGGSFIMTAVPDRIGFFTNAPRRGVDVWGELTATNRLTLAQDTGTTSPTWHIDNTASLFRLSHQPSINASGTTVMVATRSGRVGIGVNDPANTLDVQGTVAIHGTGNGLVFPDGSIQTTAVSATTLFGVCISSSPGLPSCTCEHVISQTLVSQGASCTTSGFTPGCGATSTVSTYGLCCVCR